MYKIKGKFKQISYGALPEVQIAVNNWVVMEKLNHKYSFSCWV